MNDLLRDIKDKLETNGLSPVFLESMPPKDTNAIVIYERESPMGFGADGINHGVARRVIQIRVRGSVDFAQNTSDKIMELIVTGDMRANWDNDRSIICNARSMPTRLDTLQSGKCIYACTYIIFTNRR